MINTIRTAYRERLETLLRAYIRKIKGLSIASQKAMAEKDGVSKAIYEEPASDVSGVLTDAINSIRAGDFLWIADTTVMADGRSDYMRALKILTDKKIAVQEGRTGRVSPPPHSGQFMALDATKRWSSANKGFGSMTPEEAGELGGKQTAKHRRKMKLPKTEAAKYWFDPKNFPLDTDAVIDLINAEGRRLGFKKDWTLASLYRALGPRGVPAGPKMKRKK